jgi:hypothetical protein
MAKLISTANLLQGPVKFKELTLKQYRQLLKCFLGDDISAEFIFDNTDSIIEEVTDLTKKQIKKLCFLDYCLLLFNIRQVSIGNAIFLYAEDSEEKQLKIDLPVSKIIDQIIDIKNTKLLQPESVDQWDIEYRIPSIDEITLLENQKEEYSIYTFFLKTLKFSNTIINLENYSYKEREEITQKMPVKVMTSLTRRTHSIIELCNHLNLLESINNEMFDKKLLLTLNSQVIGFIIKLLYNSNLESVYEYMFALSKFANISCSFLDDCSPGEFYLFVKKLEEINAKQQETESNTSADILPPIISEFGLE